MYTRRRGRSLTAGMARFVKSARRHFRRVLTWQDQMQDALPHLSLGTVSRRRKKSKKKSTKKSTKKKRSKPRSGGIARSGVGDRRKASTKKKKGAAKRGKDGRFK